MSKEIIKHQSIIQEDPWLSLKRYTDARIALGHTGVSIPVNESLHFKLAHAHARDAVYATLNKEDLIAELQLFNNSVMCVHSKASSRQEYLQRPDLGRVLHEDSIKLLKESKTKEGSDIVFILADGLSATAINSHAVALFGQLLPLLVPLQIKIGPMIIAEQSRVALSDSIGWLLNAKMVVMLIGERPGLSSPDSLGVYLTYAPTPGLTDESRNCISNIRPQGLSYEHAAKKITWLVTESFKRKLSGVNLKDNLTTGSLLT